MHFVHFVGTYILGSNLGLPSLLANIILLICDYAVCKVVLAVYNIARPVWLGVASDCVPTFTLLIFF